MSPSVALEPPCPPPDFRYQHCDDSEYCPFTISSIDTGTVLTAATNTMNTLSNPNAAVPRAFTFTAGKTITYNAPGFSASVLIVSVG
ncbi:hypothetical protein C8J56DRAFT_1056369 [Mycena floridula]|nr:hypothetical protein C8J56DRAFT_1056369 [Mycena floridula]